MSGSWIRSERRLAINLRDGMACAYCGIDLHGAEPETITLDHLVPRNVKLAYGGGGNEASNLVTACKSCNSSRQDRPWMSYATGGAIDRIEHLRNRELAPYLTLAKAYFQDRAGSPEIEALG